MPKLIDHDDRRTQLAEAAWRVIVRDGVAGASVRTVAAEAGVSTGSLRHLFGNHADLLVFALQLVIDRAVGRITSLPTRSDPVAAVEAVAAELLPLDQERRAEMEVYLALFTAANTNPGLRSTRDAAHQQVQDSCRWMIDRLARGGALDAGADLQLETLRLHALIDGLAAHLVYDVTDTVPDQALQVLHRHIQSLAAPAA
ncbi:TetR/AcrR family transcriptional regulator [Pseudonocardia endophytica]|uniref:TetR family transcriptional regulator n=1 Tax=Pseudonocardia endophytica TaxID=401976 RepID=A0A4R1HZT1_PSEEN|nr:TetR family transcriptional regulator C-terminal domain-containing protein [Pseudonocardia endophytica]TCK26745.1 TetR family transcriptional regulator [Pseudonocardia endophytica]